MQLVFNHTVKIPGRHSREDVWNALFFLIQNPCCFIDALVEAEVEEISADTDKKVLNRKLNFGNFEIHDTVLCENDGLVTVYIPASANIAESKNVISLKPTGDNQFNLLFEYFEDPDHPAVAASKPYHSLRYQAWKAKDLLFCKELLKKL